MVADKKEIMYELVLVSVRVGVFYIFCKITQKWFMVKDVYSLFQNFGINSGL